MNFEDSCLNLKYLGFEQRFMVPFAKWANEHLSHLRGVDTIFYPFSGPDILYPYLLNPGAKHYVLCGLEACDLFEWNEASIEIQSSDWTPLIQEAVSHYFSCGYFITKDLHAALSHSNSSGVVSILVFLLQKLGLKIHGVRPLRLSSSKPSGIGLAMPSAEDGVQIEFSGDYGLQHLYFFKRDLRDEFDANNQEVYDFLDSLGSFKVFSKSASYLLHEKNFSKVHNFLLEKSVAILQDPSHIPFERFQDRNWKVTLYGNYLKSPKVFPQYEQESLQNHELQHQVDFSFGYWMDPNQSSLMLAESQSRFSN